MALALAACGGTEEQVEKPEPEQTREPVEPCSRLADAAGIRSGEATGVVSLRVVRTDAGEVEETARRLCPEDELVTGSQVAVEIESREPIYVHVVYVGSDGAPGLLHDGAGAPLDGLLRIPADLGDSLTVSGEPGVETIALVASREPLTDAAPTLAEHVSSARAGDGPAREALDAAAVGDAAFDPADRTLELSLDDTGVALAVFELHHIGLKPRGFMEDE